MHFFAACTCLWLVAPMVFANFALDSPALHAQQFPIGLPQDGPLTLTRTTTRTRYDFEYHTLTMTEETSIPAQTTAEHANEATDPGTASCGETACAVCRWTSSECEYGTTECHECDAKAYCQC
ncbi:unnamed protein product [Zymoseptoria tritici ST99CH_1A5]|uniref:Uncharacterized protein n=1 Tax=Zymoseptoria tritici ST99CH_1A5 TaxID=1276529 RepID=A0A1Y6LMX2_ZYMTR|nr:unnamed protein product [Zymoseptoria tritici ST99CH_1A5]